MNAVINAKSRLDRLIAREARGRRIKRARAKLDRVTEVAERRKNAVARP